MMLKESHKSLCFRLIVLVTLSSAVGLGVRRLDCRQGGEFGASGNRNEVGNQKYQNWGLFLKRKETEDFSQVSD